MKLYFRQILSVLSILLAITTLKAQVDVSAFETIFNQKADKCKSGLYKGQTLYGDKSGMGVIKMKKTGIYFGDVEKGVPEGKGVLIYDKGVKNPFGDGAIYSGRFIEGRPDGKGSAYDANGKIIYSGKVVNGVALSSEELDRSRKFVSTVISDMNATFVGEVLGNKLHGAGIIIFDNGDLMLSNFVNGQHKGITVTVDASGEWLCQNITKDSNKTISSSAEYTASKETYKPETNLSWSAVSKAILGLADVVTNVGSAISDHRAVTTTDIAPLLSDEYKTPATNREKTTSSITATSSNDEKEMIEIDDAIDETRYYLNIIQRKNDKSFGYIEKLYSNALDWLQNKKNSGEEMIAKSEWDDYKSEMNRKLDKNHASIMADLRRQNKRIQDSSHRASASLYKQYAHQLKMYHEYPDQWKHVFPDGLTDVRKMQKKMKELRLKEKIEKSKWEDWDGIPGSRGKQSLKE